MGKLVHSSISLLVLGKRGGEVLRDRSRVGVLDDSCCQFRKLLISRTRFSLL